jgi:arsenate reductase
MLPKVSRFLAERAAEDDLIPADRRGLLDELAAWIRTRRAEGVPARVVFICTHNSRRSQLAQVWAKAAADWLGVGDVETFSGGTEATAFNPRAVAALQRAGFQIATPESTSADADASNPRYQVTLATNPEPLICFSKVYDSPPNPTTDFCAVMTCSDADENCPVVLGATHRIVITYVDPKLADDTPDESATYDERSAQIAREMFCAFSQVER